MKVFVNNRETETSATLLSELIESLNLPNAGIAAAINRQLVPKDAWGETPLSEGAAVTIIKAVCGG